ncbi:MAG: ABC transporter substrate-binding protein [Pseudomonadota bacterium]
MTLRTTALTLAFTALLQLSGTASFAADAAPAAQVAPAASSKEAFIEGMGTRVLAVLKDDKKPFAARQAALRSLFVEVVDTDWIAKFVLGTAWKTATPEQKAKYTELYRTYLTETYISKFDEDSGTLVKEIKITGVKDGTDGTVTAQTLIVQSGTEPAVKVNYLLRPKGDQYKIIDINIEGVSLLATHRQEFNALASKNGIDGVIAKLTELTTHK